MVSVAARWSLFSVILAAFGTFPTAYAQVSSRCNGWRSIDPQPHNPFTAQSVIQNLRWDPDGSEHTVLELPGSVARDSSGRIYDEWHSADPSARKRKITQPAVGKALGNRMSSILNCIGGKAITIYPDVEIALVEEGVPRDPEQISFFQTLAYVQRPTNATFEDLGYKEIEGFPTHGFRVTVLGARWDGEWYRKPIHMTEAWVSDDLAITMLEINTDLRSRHESRVIRSHVDRQEPEASLFEIPAGYAINPSGYGVTR